MRDLIRPALILVAILVVAVAVALSAGTAPVSLRALAEGDPTAQTIFFRIRLPRVLLGAAVGAILAVAGATFQTLLRNPLADPFVLGVSGGAAAGAALATAAGLAHLPGMVAAVAFAGACAATAVVFLLGRRRDHADPARLLLSGLVLNAFFSAVILISFALSPQSDLTAALRWMMGTLFGATWPSVAFVTTALLMAIAALLWIANDLRMLTFGEEDAKSRGVDVERVRLVAFGVASVATGAAVAVSGIIGFVGLLVPHLIRLVWRGDYRALLPLSALGGAALMVLADIGSRLTTRQTELPIGAFTAVLGVPFFLSLLRKAR